MKSRVYKGLLMAGVLTPVSMAFSLYDTAPLVGVPESYAMRYNAYVNVGYDDNLNATEHNKKSGGFVRGGVRASYADYESVSKLAYSANVGVRLYDKDAYGSDKETFTDLSANVSYRRSIGTASAYAATLYVEYTPESDYGYSTVAAPIDNAEALRLSFNNSISYAIDERWSWNVSLAVSLTDYADSVYTSSDQTYYSASTGLAYAASPNTTYGANVSFRLDDGKQRENAENYYLTGYVSHALSPISSCYLSGGLQMKTVASESDYYPSLQASYRRVLKEGLSANFYVSYDNECARYNYITSYSVDTWRAGASFDYSYTPVVSFSWGGYLHNANYTEMTNRPDYERTTWSAYVGMSYAFTEKLQGNVKYRYTDGDYYTRNVVSAGLNYQF